MHPAYANTLPWNNQYGQPSSQINPNNTNIMNAYNISCFSHVGDIYEPTSNDQARAAYIERQMKDKGSVKLPSDVPSLEAGVFLRPESLPKKNTKFLS